MLKRQKVAKQSFNADTRTMSPTKPIGFEPVAIEEAGITRELRKFKPVSVGKREINTFNTSSTMEMTRPYIKSFSDVPLMVEKEKKSNEAKKKDDELPYISPERKVIKAKLNHIYTAEPI